MVWLARCHNSLLLDLRGAHQIKTIMKYYHNYSYWPQTSPNFKPVMYVSLYSCILVKLRLVQVHNTLYRKRTLNASAWYDWSKLFFYVWFCVFILTKKVINLFSILLYYRPNISKCCHFISQRWPTESEYYFQFSFEWLLTILRTYFWKMGQVVLKSFGWIITLFIKR